MLITCKHVYDKFGGLIMKVIVCKDSVQLGQEAAKLVAAEVKRCIAEKGSVRMVFSTGSSQFDTFKALLQEDIDWTKVDMFHLDEYVGLPETHPASFRKYLKERFTNLVPLHSANFVDGTPEGIKAISEALTAAPIDIGLIGIGENSHIAFNDPPADFDVEDPYIVVNLNDTCKKQQVGEGWFPTIDDVPKQAVSMSVKQILKCNKIISCVPHKVKANAIKLTIENDTNNLYPATIMKQHKDLTLLVDVNSASLINKEMAERCCPTLEEYIEL